MTSASPSNDNNIGASYIQKGRAAELRTYVGRRTIRQKLNEIVHSGDREPKYYNPYIDQSNQHDDRVDSIIAEAVKDAERTAEFEERLRGVEQEQQQEQQREREQQQEQPQEQWQQVQRRQRQRQRPQLSMPTLHGGRAKKGGSSSSSSRNWRN